MDLVTILSTHLIPYDVSHRGESPINQYLIYFLTMVGKGTNSQFMIRGL